MSPPVPMYKRGAYWYKKPTGSATAYEQRKCATCGTDFFGVRTRYATQGLYCSRKCARAGPLNPDWRELRQEITRPALERFSEQWTEDADGCHIWREDGRDKDGYGRFYGAPRPDGSTGEAKAHRWIFEQMHGYAPAVVMHRCDKPPCVNWEKCLMAGTTASNNEDMMAKERGGHGVTGGARGERHHLAVMTDPEVLEVRRLYALGGISQRALAERFGVHRTSICMIINGKRRAGG